MVSDKSKAKKLAKYGVYRVEPAVQEVFVDALMTIPIPPMYSKVRFRYESIKVPYTSSLSPNIEAKDEYYKLCNIKNVIPFSSVKIEGRHGKLNHEVRCNSIALIKPCHFNEFIIDVSYPYGNLSEEVKQIYENLLKNGYEIADADLWLSADVWENHQEGGANARSYLKFGYNRVGEEMLYGGLELRIAKDDVGKKTDELKLWWDESIVPNHKELLKESKTKIAE